MNTCLSRRFSASGGLRHACEASRAFRETSSSSVGVIAGCRLKTRAATRCPNAVSLRPTRSPASSRAAPRNSVQSLRRSALSGSVAPVVKNQTGVSDALVGATPRVSKDCRVKVAPPPTPTKRLNRFRSHTFNACTAARYPSVVATTASFSKPLRQAPMRAPRLNVCSSSRYPSSPPQQGRAEFGSGDRALAPSEARCSKRCLPSKAKSASVPTRSIGPRRGVSRFAMATDRKPTSGFRVGSRAPAPSSSVRCFFAVSTSAPTRLHEADEAKFPEDDRAAVEPHACETRSTSFRQERSA